MNRRQPAASALEKAGSMGSCLRPSARSAQGRCKCRCAVLCRSRHPCGALELAVSDLCAADVEVRRHRTVRLYLYHVQCVRGPERVLGLVHARAQLLVGYTLRRAPSLPLLVGESASCNCLALTNRPALSSALTSIYSCQVSTSRSHSG